MASSPETDGVYSALRRIVISEPGSAGDSRTASILAPFDAALTRGSAPETTEAPAPQPASTTNAVPEPAPAPPADEAERIERTSGQLVASITDGVPDPGPKEPSARAETVQPIADGALFRSRLNWFVGVSDVSAQDPGSLTYEPYFGLREKPFSLAADPRFFFSRSPHGAAFDTLAAGIRRREGILVVTGEVGTGKTTLCRAVLQSLDQKMFAAFVPDPFLSREDLLKTLLVDFGIVSIEDVRSGRLRGASRAELSYPLYDFLASLQPLRAFAVVMIDEAQNLTPELLEEVRVLSDLENGQKLLEVVLVGQPELETRLASSEMRQLSQRVAVRCHLGPLLSRDDVQAYVMHRLAIAGNDGRVQFSDAAIGLVATASSGIPRVVNLVCDRALLVAARARKTRIEAEYVMSAVSELELPVAAALQHHEPRPQPQPHLPPQESVQAPAPPAPAPVLAAGPPPAPAPARIEEPVGGFAFFGHEYRPAESYPPPDTLAAKPGSLVRHRRLSPLAVRGAAPGSPAGDVALGHPSEPASRVPDMRPAEFAAPAPSRGRWLPAVAVGLVVVAGSMAYWYSSAARPRALSSKVSLPAAPPPSLAPAQATARPAAPEAATNARAKEGPARESAAAATASRFAVQMATFQTAARAEQAARELTEAGFRAYSIQQTLRDGGPVFGVLLGPYGDRREADQNRDRARNVPGYGTGRVVEVGATAPPASPLQSLK